jgi:hypothetical protein
MSTLQSDPTDLFDDDAEATEETGVNDGLRTVMMAKLPRPEDQTAVMKMLAVLTAFIGKLSQRIYDSQMTAPENESAARLRDAIWCVLQIPAKRGFYPLSKMLFGFDDEAANSYFKRIGLRMCDFDPEKPKRKLPSGLRARAVKDAEIARRVQAYDRIGEAGLNILPEFAQWKDWLPGWVQELIMIDALQYVRSHFNLKRERTAKLEKFAASKAGKALIAAFAQFDEGVRHRLTTTELLALVNWEGKKKKVVAVGRIEDEFGELLRLNPSLRDLMKVRRDYLRFVTMLEKTTWRPLTWNGAKRFPFLPLDKFLVPVCDGGKSRFAVTGRTSSVRVRTVEISDEDLKIFMSGEVNGNFTFVDKKSSVQLQLVSGTRLSRAIRNADSDCFQILDPRSGAMCEHCFKGFRFRKGDDGRYEAMLTFQPKVVMNDPLVKAIEQYEKKEVPTFAPGTMIASFSPTITGHYDGGESGQVGWLMVWGCGEDGKPTEPLFSTQITPYIPFQKGERPKQGKRGFHLQVIARNGSEVISLVLNPATLARKNRVVIKHSDGSKARFYRASAAAPLDRQQWKRVRVSGTFYAPTRGASLPKIVEIRSKILRLQKLSGKGIGTKQDGTPRKTLEKRDFQRLWDKFSRVAKELRRLTAIQLLRQVLRVSGVLRQQHPKQPGDDTLVATPKRIVEWQKKYGSQLPVLLLLPIPKSSAHQPWRTKPENRILHMFGPAGMLESTIFKAALMGFPYVTVSKSGNNKRCPACGTVAAKGSSLGHVTFECCDRGRNGWPRGALLCLNQLHRLMNPAEKVRTGSDDSDDE